MTNHHSLDAIVRMHSAFDSFDALVNAAGRYTPTIRCYDERVFNARERADLERLADAYDAHMESIGDERRAHRGSRPVAPAPAPEPVVEQAPAPAAPAAPALPETLVAGEQYSVFRNQGSRDATVLAVIGDEALISYEMPSGVTYLNIVAADGSDAEGAYRAVSPKALPKRWREAVLWQTGDGVTYTVRRGRELIHRPLLPRGVSRATQHVA